MGGSGPEPDIPFLFNESQSRGLYYAVGDDVLNVKKWYCMELRGSGKMRVVSQRTERIRTKIGEAIRLKHDALQRMEDVLGDPATTPAMIESAQAEVERLTAVWKRLMHDFRVAQLEAPERFGAYRTRVGQRPLREQVLDILDELGVPNSPRVVSEYALACLGIDLPVARFASLRRDEERSFRKDALSKPAWVVPALNMTGFAPMPRLVASSVWSIERRLIGPRTLRVNHIVTLLALLRRASTITDGEEAVRGIKALIFQFARSVPGAWAVTGEPDLERIRVASEAELQAIGPHDEAERKQAAVKLAKLPQDRQIWGLPPVVKREPQVDYKVSG